MTYVFGNCNDIRLKHANVLELDNIQGLFIVSQQDSDATLSYTSSKDVIHCQGFDDIVKELLKSFPADSIVFLTQRCADAIKKIVKHNAKHSLSFTKAKF